MCSRDIMSRQVLKEGCEVVEVFFASSCEERVW